MSPELRILIYGSIIGVVAAGLTALVKLAVDKFGGRKAAPIDRGKNITALADSLIDASTASVAAIRSQLDGALADLTRARGELDGSRAELAESRTELAAAREELTATKRMMETREANHAAVLGRMRRRIAQLVQVLTDNNLAVPDEEGDLISAR